MKSLNDCMQTYKREVKKGDIKQAYTGLMRFFKDLQAHFKYACLDFSVTSNIYYGCMDLTFISFATELLKREKLKIAIVFNHDEFRFEVWLTGANKKIQERYLKLLKEKNWTQYPLTSTTKNITYISSSIIVVDPDFSKLDKLTQIIEKETLAFINSFEDFISNR